MSHSSQLNTLQAMVGGFDPGTVCLVGAGPGDSPLISVRGAMRLMQSDVVLYDKLIGPELLNLPRPEATRVFVGKERGQHTWPQEKINAAMVHYARENKRVVRLKGGDPFVFGRGGEECAFLAQAGIPYEVVPGITAAFGAPATAGIPPTHRGMSRSFALVTGHADENDETPLDFEALARMDTLAIYMGLDRLEYNCKKLIAAGRPADTPVAVIHWGTTPHQRTVVGTLQDIADRVAIERLESPALVMIGQTVKLRQSIEWFEHRPLAGKTVVVTRMRHEAGDLSGPLQMMGAEVIVAPTIELADVEDFDPIDEALQKLDKYDWVVLTSGNGVDALFRRLQYLGGDARWLAPVKIAVVGSGTMERLMSYSVKPDLIPPEAVGESLSKSLIDEGMRKKKVLLLRADIARSRLPQLLTKAGAKCDDLPIYRTICADALPPLFWQRYEQGRIDWITLTSPSTFINLLMMMGKDNTEGLWSIKLASIGPVTTRAIREAGYMEAAEASPHDIGGLVRSIRAAENG